nr:hypothetical protein CFP56_74592 [Quercus suber]
MHVSHLVISLALCSQSTLACLQHARIIPRDGTNQTASNQTSTFEIRVTPRPLKTKTAIVNVRVFDGYELKPPASLIFDGDTIVEDQQNVDHVIDGRGAVVLPGLIDSHCHPESYDHLEKLSSYGVTTAMNMACHDYEICAALRDQVGLTGFFTAGFPAQGPGSQHALAQNTPADKLISSPSQAPDFVRQSFQNGGDWLKITAEANGPDQATQNALVEYAHALGRRTMTHAATHEFYVMAIDSGTNGPQHIPYDELLSSDSLEKMWTQRQFATPTMNLNRRVFMDPEAFAALTGGSQNVSFQQAYDIVQDNVRALRNYSIPVLAGTDAFEGDLYPVRMPFGLTLHEELQNLVDIGFTTADALRAATLVPAMAHGLVDRGRLAAGMRADFVLLEPGADPLRNITETLKIAKVWNGGVEYTGALKISD